MTTALQQFTLVLAVDAEHSQELMAVWRVWIHFHPEILDIPLVIFVDDDGPEGWIVPLMRFIDRYRTGSPSTIFSAWRHPQSATQREKMLSAFVFGAPEIVRTPYWLKLDTDLVATAPGPLIRDHWLNGEPAFFAPAWNYTRPASMLDRLDDWITPFSPPMPPFPRTIVGDKARHPRVISYFMGVKTEWSRQVAAKCRDKMPVPSQDTIFHHFAARHGSFYRTINAKSAGWRHVGSRGIQRIEQAAREAMNGQVPA